MELVTYRFVGRKERNDVGTHSCVSVTIHHSLSQSDRSPFRLDFIKIINRLRAAVVQQNAGADPLRHF